MKRSSLMLLAIVSILWAAFAIPAEAQGPQGGYVVAPQVVIVNGGTYSGYGTYGNGYGFSGGYRAPYYPPSVPYGAGYGGGYQPYRDMYYQRLYYGLGTR